jgi:hypothetical protein
MSTPDSTAKQHFIEVIVITTADDLDDSFNRKDKLRVVFEHALRLVGGEGKADQFALEYEDQTLDLDRTLEQYATEFGWGEKVELELVPKPVVV